MNPCRDLAIAWILFDEEPPPVATPKDKPEDKPKDNMSSPPFNHSMHQSAYNTSYHKRRAPQRVEDEVIYSSDEDYDSEYDYDRRSDRSETPERERRRSYAADGARDMPRRRQYITNDRYAPRGVYDPSSDRTPNNDTTLARYQSHQNDGYLNPYPNRRNSDAGFYNGRRRERADSMASHSSRQSHRSHRSTASHRSSASGRSDRDKYDRDGRRRSRHHEHKPTMGDSVMLLVNSVKNAFDRRK